MAEPTKSYADFMLGKRVVLVGPAPSIVGSQQHDLIESYDVVVRLNHALPVPENLFCDIGRRTDVLCSTVKIPKSLNPDLKLVKDAVQWVVCPYSPDSPPFNRYVREFRSRNTIGLPFLCEAISADIGTRPTIGLAAIIHILQHRVKKLYVTGLTFFKRTTGNDGGYYDEYKNEDDYKEEATEAEVMKLVKKIGVHDMDKHISHMRGLVVSDLRLVCDAGMMEVLHE